MSQLRINPTGIPGLVVVDLAVHGDARGWFKENWQRAKMTDLGLPDFGPVQHSVAYNGPAGVTRGIHAEPWDKLVSVAHGRVFGAWVDLRQGPTFGELHTAELDESTAVFVPRGVGNSYQTLVDHTVYSYLVNAHWSPEATYTHLNLADPTVAVDWPIALSAAEISDKDRGHPLLGQLQPVPPRRTLVIGASGQLGRDLMAAVPGAESVSQERLDLAVPETVRSFSFDDVAVVINAAAMTDVDGAESTEGRRRAWAVNAQGVAELARAAVRTGFTLVHYSTDYVFDGTDPQWSPDGPLAPLSAYGQSKAAGDLAVGVAPRHYIIRTSWLVGDGPNFVRTMRRLARQGVRPRVVADQFGRLTFAHELAKATRHLLQVQAPYGVYNVTNSGAPLSWAEIAREVFARSARDPGDVVAITAADYAAAQQRTTALRPASSVLTLDALHATGFASTDQLRALDDYLDPVGSS
jgi:dTDP-4-dehydrorhamnose reductase/dTDP-4-dehydrorhamnose 3,5-epimerase